MSTRTRANGKAAARLLAVAALTLAFGSLPVSAADGQQRAASGGEAASPQLPAISVVRAEHVLIADIVRGSGYVRPVEDVFVQPEVEGLAIETVKAEVGDRVEAGAVLATLSRDALELERSRLEASRAKAEAGVAQSQALLSEAEANAEEAVRVRDRYEILSGNGTISRAQFDQAEAAANAALARQRSAEQSLVVARSDIDVIEAQLSDIALRLARTDIKAPVAGIVSARSVRIGAIASANGEPLFTIMKDGALELRADISEDDVLKLSPGQAVEAVLPSAVQPVAGTVRLVEPTVDLSTRLGVVRIALEQPGRVKAGMFAEAAIVVERKQAVVLPVSTVSVGDDGAMVLKIVDGRVAVTPVVTGIRDGGLVEIVEGIEAGDEVVAKAGAFVRDGDRVNPVPATETASRPAPTVGN